MDIAQANEEFGIPGVLSIGIGKGGLPLICIDNAFARAEICAYAGQMLSYLPAGEPEDLLFVSRDAYFQPGKAIKGGIPLCWPWFGPDPEARGRPAHGFVRDRPWSLLSTEAMVDGTTRVRLGIRDDAETRALWPLSFSLELEVTVGAELTLALISHNPGEQAMTITQALHTYFRVGDVRAVRVEGLSGRTYVDKVGSGGERLQEGPVTVAGEVNRIYLDTTGELIIDDPTLGRRIHITRSGSRSVVVWNPWIETSAAMDDLADDEYPHMLCVETTNAAPGDPVSLRAGGEYRLETRYRIQRG